MTRPNVLLIVMDTARAQSVLGRPEVAPNLHRLASDGVTFTRAFSTAPWTLPSHASLFSGQYTSDHGTHAGSRTFDPEVPTLAERLRDAGYQTRAFSNNTWVSPEFGFDRGFDEFTVGWELVEGGVDLASIGRNHDGTADRLRAVCRNLLDREAPQSLLNAAFSMGLRKRWDDGARVANWRIRRQLSGSSRQEPFFLFVNYLEPHLEYDPPERFRYQFLPDDVDPEFVDSVRQDAWAYLCGELELGEREFAALTALYRAELAYLDHRIGQLLEFLEAQGVLEDTAVFVTGDHGENIGEHGLMDHQYCLYDTLLHVPLFARYPGALDGGVETDDLVELRDLYATILELAGVDPPVGGDRQPRSLLDAAGRDRVVGEYVTPQPSMDALAERVGTVPEDVRRFDRGLRSVRTDEWKYVEGTDGSEELYRVATDPEESRDRAADRPEVCAELRERLEATLGPLGAARGDSEPDDAAVDDSTQQRLEDLGYLQ